MKHYAAGFLFNDFGNSVALIHKLKGPPTVVGMWNALGGKVEPHEDSLTAMRREFVEEAGVDVNNWEKFLTLKGRGWQVDFFVAYDSFALSRIRTMEVEQVAAFDIKELPKLVPNLKWILPMALGIKDENMGGYTVTEQEFTD